MTPEQRTEVDDLADRYRIPGQDREEVRQEAYLAWLEATRDGTDPMTAARTRLEVVQAREKRYRNHRRPLHEADDAPVPPAREPSSRVDVRALLDDLPPRERQVLIADAHFKDKKADAAASLGLSLRAFKTLRTRALARIRASKVYP